MTLSYTQTETSTFTIVHAKHMAAKIAADLKRLQRFYGSPNDTWITFFETEIIELLRSGYLAEVTYGFRHAGNWIAPTLKYTAQDLAGTSSNDDDPGRIQPGADIKDAFFYSYLTYNSSWADLSVADRTIIEEKLPFKRGGATEPGISGYFSNDRTYSAGGRAVSRAIVRSY